MLPPLYDTVSRILIWTKLKCRIQVTDRPTPYFREREVWWVHLGENVGFEQNGKNDEFDRPALIIKKFGMRQLLVLPLTTTDRSGPYLYPTSRIRGARPSKVSLSQVRTISSKRLIRKAWVVSEKEYRDILEQLRKMLFTPH